MNQNTSTVKIRISGDGNEVIRARCTPSAACST